jgi:hypothetical protein
VIITDADCGQFDDLCDDGVKPLKDRALPPACLDGIGTPWVERASPRRIDRRGRVSQGRRICGAAGF